MNRIKELQETIAKMQVELESLKRNGKRWRSKDDDDYYFIDDYGDVASATENCDRVDDARYLIGNYLRTPEEAQRALDRMIATQQLKDRIAELNAEQGWVVDWSNDKQDKYIAMFEHKNKRRLLASYCGYSYSGYPIEFYGSKQTIETVIAEIPEQIKFWLGVE